MSTGFEALAATAAALAIGFSELSAPAAVVAPDGLANGCSGFAATAAAFAGVGLGFANTEASLRITGTLAPRLPLHGLKGFTFATGFKLSVTDNGGWAGMDSLISCSTSAT